MEFHPIWGPYSSGPETLHYLSSFTNAAVGAAPGIVWAVNGVIYPLRAPSRDGGGYGDTIVFHWDYSPITPQRQPGFLNSIEDFLDRVMQAEAEGQLAQAQAYQAEGALLTTMTERMFSSHQDDGVGVLLDVVGIAFSLALLSTGVGFVGGVVLLGGAVLLGA